MNHRESVSLKGIFHFFDHPGYSTEELREWIGKGMSLLALPGVSRSHPAPNTIMATQKLLAANAVYPTATGLVITNDTSTPSDAETSYLGSSIIYTTSPSEEYVRSGNILPYTLGYNITSEAANGPWGSVILINGSGQMINRALAGVTKTSGKGKLVFFTGNVT